MTPSTFLHEVAQPNMQAALEKPGSMRAVVNAVLTLDALAGVIHASAPTGPQSLPRAFGDGDDEYRDQLALISPSFRVLRDMAAAIKHGELSPHRKKARFVRSSDAMESVLNTLGLLQCGDLSDHVVVIDFQPGPGFVRASDVIADSYRMLKRISDGGEARTDENDSAGIPPISAFEDAGRKPAGPATNAVERMEAEIAADRGKRRPKA